LKTPISNDGDAGLDALLRDWQPRPTLPPRFQEQVWRRIERAETSPRSPIVLVRVIGIWLSATLARPMMAAAYLSTVLLSGAGFGWMQARHESMRVANELGVRYARTIDPYHFSR
jgi:hypothetical protein